MHSLWTAMWTTDRATASGVATGRSERVPEDATIDLESLWAHAIDGLTDSTVTPQQRAWLRTTRPLGLLDGTALLAAPNEFTKDVLETRLRPMITTALSGLLGRDIRVAVTVEPPATPEVPEAAVEDPDQVAEDTQPGLTWPPPSPSSGRSHGRIEPARLNPKYTFETFVIGSSNRFAHAAAVAVAEAPAKAYNPLFIYGDSGLGKTHLLHAIGHYAQRLFHNARVRYVSSEEFTNDFINSMRDDKQSAFQRRYRDNDMLLVDDIQFLENKERTQEEFFHTFNTLHNANKQIVISSDRSPKQLSTLEDRLRTRFEWGLITDVQPPDLETRIAILRKKAAQERLTRRRTCWSSSRRRSSRTSASSRAR